MMTPADLIDSRGANQDPYAYYTFDDFEKWKLEIDGKYGLSYKMSYDSDSKRRVKTDYVELIATMDTETTSDRYVYAHTGRRIAYMYVWMFCLQGITIVGRTWSQYIELTHWLVDHFGLSYNKRLAVYVHNLAFDFQFLAFYFSWRDVFSVKKRTPVRALTEEGIEYRCSYQLTGLPLSKLPVHETCPAGSVPSLPERYWSKFHKMVGDLDYLKVRTPITPLTPTEIRYCVADVVVLAHHIADRLHDYGDTIASVPMTRTGYVRRDVRAATIDGKNKKQYRALVKSMTLTPYTYSLLRSAYMGGFTHANARNVGRVCHNVLSMDITSSYPTVMVAEKYPCGPFVREQVSRFESVLDYKACLITLRMTKLQSRCRGDNPISASKCANYNSLSNNNNTIITDNGRLIQADEVVLTCTEIDFSVYKEFYTWEKLEVLELYTAPKSYLPTEYVAQVLKYYARKTELKGIASEETLYSKMKEYVNAIYGMAATAVVKDLQVYDYDGWRTETPDTDEAIERVNTSKNRFLFYGWAPWVTAYARRRLFDAILFLGDAYIYADTDSVKFFWSSEREAWFAKANADICQKLEKACDYHGLSHDLIYPRNRKEKVCPLGVWDYDGFYLRFKTLGAKRYLTESLEEIEVDEYDDDGPTGRKIGTGWYQKVIHTTVAGVSKPYLAAYLAAQPDPFAAFDSSLVLPARWKNYEGRPVHYYIDNEEEAVTVDCYGQPAEVWAPSGIYLDAAEYHLDVATDYDAIRVIMAGLDILHVEKV